MRVRTFRRGGYGGAGLSTDGGSLNGPLLLSGDPIELLEAATKQYIDGIMIGHISDALLHPSTSEKALLSGITVTSAELNRLTGITSSVQSQLNNKMLLTGGVFLGVVNLHGDPTNAMHAVTKQYIDGALVGTGGLVIGDIIRKPSSVVPTGFLRANGAELSKTTYSALFAVIGENFNDVVPFGSGKPWKQQYDINLTQSTDITGWTVGTPLPITNHSYQAIVTKNRVYILGGFISGTTASSVVYTAPINTDSTLGIWVLGTPLPIAVRWNQAVVTKNRVYILGGMLNGNTNTAIVYTAPINTDGSLGIWTTGTSLPETVTFSQAIVTKNRVYLLGGMINGADSAIVYTAPINTDGTLGSWVIGSVLPGTVTFSQAIVTKNRVYLLGGRINNADSAVVYTAPINTDGTLGIWTTGTSLPETVTFSQAIVTKNRVHILGGWINGTNSAVVYTAPINTDGTLGTWTTGTSLPGTVLASQAIVTKNRVYLLGGVINGSSSAVVYTASITGGLNDYSPYYDGTINATDPLNFNLPDLSVEDASIPNSYQYIKS